MKSIIFSLIVIVIFTRGAQAEPTCNDVLDCIDQVVPKSVSECFAASHSVTCATGVQEKTYLTAGILADRALAAKGCTAHAFTTEKACRRCYDRAIAPITDRYLRSLFHGLLANTVGVLKRQRNQACSPLP